jgi:hypothetical protein
MSMDRRKGSAAAFPGERSRFEVSLRPDDGAVTWLGGGEPFTGSGRRFATRFGSGGIYTVSAQSGDARVDFAVTVCPVDAWLEDARSFYGPSIDFSRVIVKSSRLVAGPPRTGWTCNNVVRFKRPRHADGLPQESTLIHELAHVWQHQSGRVQLLKGLVEQAGRLVGRDPYDFGGPAGLRRTEHLTQLSNESQAQVITEYWRSQRGHRADHRRVPFSTPGYVDDLRRLVEGAGIGMTSPSRTARSAIDAAAARLVNAVVNLFG